MTSTTNQALGLPPSKKGDGQSKFKTPREWLSRALVPVAALAFGAFGGLTPAHAVPSFARQTGEPCSACHTTIPNLTAFGRQFKVGGYTQKTDGAPALPLAAFIQSGFVHTIHDQGAQLYNGSTKTNNAFGMDQASLFISGKLFGNVGSFIQITMDNDHTIAWDNMDIRYAKTGTMFGKSGTFGIDVNNNPTVQDPWNTLPAWGFPQFTTHAGVAAPDLGVAPIVANLGGNVLGVTGYGMFDNGLYTEFGAYDTLPVSMSKFLGAGDPGFKINGLAPYARIAYSHDVGNGTLMVGALGMLVNQHATGTSTSGKDRYVDLGIDTQYDYSGSNYGLSFRARDIVEKQTLSQAVALGNASNRKNNLNAFDASLTYTRSKWAAIGGYSSVTGSADSALYGGSPNGQKVILEVNYSPWMDGSPFKSYKDVNLKLGAQYNHYLKLNGTTANASDNDYIYLYTILAF